MVGPVDSKVSGVGLELPRKAQVSNSVPASDKPAVSPSLDLGVTALSPRMRSDPIAGILITEYLSDDGQVERQYPSEVAVAYLRSGLMENGTVDPDNVAVIKQDDPVLV